MAWRVEAGLCTSRGPDKRRNEDSAAVGALLLTGDSSQAHSVFLPVGAPTVALIADGMGGHASGEVASRLAVESLLADGGLRSGDTKAVSAALCAANETLHDRSQEDARLEGMGATVVGVVVSPIGNGIAFNVGDSRLLLRDRDLGVVQFSVDDAQRSGTGTASQLSQCLGGTLRLTAISPHVRELPIAAGDRLILCSDGLSDVLSGEEIASVIADGGYAAEAAQALLDLAIERAAYDDVTVVVLDIAADA